MKQWTENQLEEMHVYIRLYKIEEVQIKLTCSITDLSPWGYMYFDGWQWTTPIHSHPHSSFPPCIQISLRSIPSVHCWSDFERKLNNNNFLHVTSTFCLLILNNCNFFSKSLHVEQLLVGSVSYCKFKCQMDVKSLVRSRLNQKLLYLKFQGRRI